MNRILIVTEFTIIERPDFNEIGSPSAWPTDIQSSQSMTGAYQGLWGPSQRGTKSRFSFLQRFSYPQHRFFTASSLRTLPFRSLRSTAHDPCSQSISPPYKYSSSLALLLLRASGPSPILASIMATVSPSWCVLDANIHTHIEQKRA